jgi:hypothetical protein
MTFHSLDLLVLILSSLQDVEFSSRSASPRTSKDLSQFMSEMNIRHRTLSDEKHRRSSFEMQNVSFSENREAESSQMKSESLHCSSKVEQSSSQSELSTDHQIRTSFQIANRRTFIFMNLDDPNERVDDKFEEDVIRAIFEKECECRNLIFIIVKRLKTVTTADASKSVSLLSFVFSFIVNDKEAICHNHAKCLRNLFELQI